VENVGLRIISSLFFLFSTYVYFSRRWTPERERNRPVKKVKEVKEVKEVRISQTTRTKQLFQILQRTGGHVGKQMFPAHLKWVF
jgi:hypothetical protein